MSSLIESIIREAQDHIETECKAAEEAQLLASAASNEEIRRLQEQNAYLVSLLETEKVKSERAKDDLIKRISGLLGEFVNERDRSLREAVTDISESNERGEEVMVQFGEDHGKKVEGIVTRAQEWAPVLSKKGGEGKRLRDGALKVSFFLCTLHASNPYDRVRFLVAQLSQRHCQRRPDERSELFLYLAFDIF